MPPRLLTSSDFISASRTIAFANLTIGTVGEDCYVTCSHAADGKGRCGGLVLQAMNVEQQCQALNNVTHCQSCEVNHGNGLPAVARINDQESRCQAAGTAISCRNNNSQFPRACLCVTGDLSQPWPRN